MKIIIHGAAKEVGRSCVELVTNDYTRILLDAGLKLTPQGHSEYPEKLQRLSEIDGVLLCHAHLDHCGALPLFDHQGLSCPVYATPATKALARLILEDAYKIGKLEHQQLGYFEEDIYKILMCVRNIRKKVKGAINSINFEFFNAGHIPGSASAVVEADGKKLLYTSDIKTTETRLHNPADTGYADYTEKKTEENKIITGNNITAENKITTENRITAENRINAMICEATYGDREHPPRKKTEKEFIEEIKKTTENGGSVLIPSFAVGRAQELLLLLNEGFMKGSNIPVYIDGMAAKATKIILGFSESVKDHRELSKAFSSARTVKGFRERSKIMKKQGIFITTSGMLTGGPIMHYLKALNNEKNSLLLTGYQAEHTNGRMLEESGMVYLDGWKTRIKCSWKKFDFSAHSGLSDLKDLIKKVNPEKLIFNHGDPSAIKNISEWSSAVGFKTYTPDIGGVITI